MTTLLIMKEHLKTFYAAHSALVLHLFRFFLCFAALEVIGRNAGYIAILTTLPVEFLMSLFGCFLPMGAAAVLVGMVLLAQVYRASMELAVITLVLILLILLLYYGFEPGDSALLLAAPVFMQLSIPYALAVIVGLTGSVISVIPMSCGILFYYILLYAGQAANLVQPGQQTEFTEVFARILEGLAGNRTMLIVMAACALGVLVIWAVRIQSFHYSWPAAYVAGIVVMLFLVFFLRYHSALETSVAEMTLAALVSLATGAVCQFLFFLVDYSRTEYLQYEDESYYYYVKAVPKASVPRTDVKVQKFNRVKKKEKPGERGKHGSDS